MIKKKIPSYHSSSYDSTSDSDDVVQPLPKIISKIPTATNKIIIPRTARSGTKRPIHNEDDLAVALAAKKTTTTTTMPGREPEPLVDYTLIAAAAAAATSATTPAEVKEYRNSYVLEIDVPGMKLEDIKVEVKDDENVVVISGERKREEEVEEGVKYLRMETRVGKFIRSFVLPHNANMPSVSASCRNGVLSVTVLKKLVHPDHSKKPVRTIPVRNGLY